MIFKRLLTWLDDYFSRDERKQITKQKLIIEDLSNQVKQLKEKVGLLTEINKKLSENNKKLIKENSQLKQQVQLNEHKAECYDLICKVVEEDVLKQVLELTNQK